jgi:FHA domain/Domain of unknown function (DUF4388)
MAPDLRRDTVKIGNLLSIAEQIQAFGLAGKTGEIYVTNVPPPARINLIEGAVVDAQFGFSSGLEAAIALINLPDPQSEFIVGERASRRTIDLPYVQLLCEAARIKDESIARQETEPLPLSAGHPHLRLRLGSEIKNFPIRPGLAGLGRAPAPANEIVIDEATVSQRHATLEYSREGILLRDLGSTNGTYVAGRRIKEQWLHAQENLQFGSVHGLFIGGMKKSSA